MICFFAALIKATVPQNLDPREELRYFSWIAFVIVSLVYSAFVFRGELSKDGPLFFSRKNARSTRDVLASHSAFLVFLFCFMRVFNFIVPSLPYWMTDTFNAGKGNRLSIADFVFMALTAVLAFVERRWLFVERRDDGVLRSNDSA